MTFWYGLGFDDLSRMPIAALRAYLRDLPKHKAEMQLLRIEAAAFVYLDDAARAEKIRLWESALRGEMRPGGERQYALNPETQIFEEVYAEPRPDN